MLALIGIVALPFWVRHKFAHNVSYDIGGTARTVRIQYREQGARGDQERTLDAVTPPWSKTVYERFMVEPATVTAEIPQGVTGTVNCTLRVDGKVVSTQASDKVVRCSDTER